LISAATASIITGWTLMLHLGLLHLGDREGQDAVLEDRLGLVGLEALGQPQGPFEGADMQLAAVILPAF
jgi:hypothetical protein